MVHSEQEFLAHLGSVALQQLVNYLQNLNIGFPSFDRKLDNLKYHNHRVVEVNSFAAMTNQLHEMYTVAKELVVVLM